MKLWDIYTKNFCDIFNLSKILIDNNNKVPNKSSPTWDTSQIAGVVDELIQQLQVPNNNQPEASEHETSNQLGQIKHVQSDDSVVNMTQHDPEQPE